MITKINKLGLLFDCASMARIFMLFLALFCASTVLAQTPPGFNHSSTGFILQGAHVQVPCAGCHGAGVPTRGVPRDCNTCHVQGTTRATTFKSPSHIPATSANQQCLDCHNQNTFSGAVMKHTTDMFGQCARCHNSLQAPGKSLRHILTQASCDACHTTGRWTPTKGMFHDATTVGRCSTCHNGTIASGKPPTHVQTNAQCDTCHTSTVSWLSAQFLHDSSMIGRCSTCHNNQTAKGRPAGHIPTNAQCDTCHTSYVAFTFVTMNHSGLNGQCSTCHSGGYLSQNAQMKPVTHTPTSAQCDTCHKSTVTWATSMYSHTDPTVTYVNNCSTCHKPGGPGLSKPSTHIPTAAQCDTCHTNFTAFRPAVMNHTGLTGQCSTCHNGAYVSMNAQTKPVIHIPTTRTCDACHTTGYIQWYPGMMDHSIGAAGQCSTCHSGAYLSENAQMKPVTHVSTTAQCDTCHKSTTSWATAVYAHTDPTVTYISNCSTCHKAGGPGLNKPTNHIPTAMQCDTCHTNFLAFRPAFMNHTGVNGTCNTCHNGSYTFARADKQGVTHIPDTRQCDTCHTTTTDWTSRVMNHTGLNGKCNICHNGSYLSENADRQGATHIPETRQCDVCHTSTLNWIGMNFQHPATAPKNCSTCHLGQYLTENAQSRPGLPHVQTGQCDNCHSSYVSWATGTTSPHTPTNVITTGCSTCHGAGVALGKSTNHIPTGTNCEACHLNTNYVAFKPAAMDHTKTAAPVPANNCSSCHNTTYAAVNAMMKPASHIPTAAQCDYCHSNTGYVSWTNRVMKHDATAYGATACTTCHSGGYLTSNAQAKGTNHIPIGTNQCGPTCHTAPPSGNSPGFSPATMGTAGHALVTGRCDSCHGGAYVSENALTKTPTHIAVTPPQDCSACHAGYVSWATAAKPPHNSALICDSCHKPLGGALSKPPNHIPTTAQCSACHKDAAFATFARPTGMTMDHTKVAATTCSTCHGGAFVSQNAQAKDGTHIPTTVECNSCHNSTTVWTTGTMNHAVVAATQCGTCHNGAYVSQTFGVLGGAKARPSNHIPYQTYITGGATMDCNACHTSTVLWTAEKMNHNATSANCRFCHQTGVAYLGSMMKMAMTHNKKTATGDCSQSGCHRPLGNVGTPYSKWN